MGLWAHFGNKNDLQKYSKCIKNEYASRKLDYERCDYRAELIRVQSSNRGLQYQANKRIDYVSFKFIVHHSQVEFERSGTSRA